MASEAFAVNDIGGSWTRAEERFISNSSYEVTESIIYKPRVATISPANENQSGHYSMVADIDNQVFKFSGKVHRLFWCTVALFGVCVVLSLIAVIIENQYVAIAAACAVAGTLICSALWIERADREWRKAKSA